MRQPTAGRWRRGSSFGCWPLSSLAVAGLLALWAAGFCRAAEAPRPVSCEVEEVRGLPYYRGDGVDPVHHKLNLYLPHGVKDYPILVMVHGGAWLFGDCTFFGWGDSLGRYFAQRGFGVVMPSYRLSPDVRHPEHVKDLARALAWTVKNLPGYGGCTDKLFLCGHSAGGHLVSLVATDPQYLKKEGLPLSVVKGVISVSGVYRIPALNLNFTLPKQAGAALDVLAQLLADPAASKGKTVLPVAPQDPIQVRIPVNLFEVPFGSNEDTCRDASPLCHVRPGLPPFLIVNADCDWPLLPEMAVEFVRALKAVGCPVEAMTATDRDHEGVMFRATAAEDPVAQAIERFVRQQCRSVPTPPSKAAGP
jgi:arylformamidase